MAVRRINFHTTLSAIVCLAALLAYGTAAADPPARVARMANIGGPVSFSPAGEDEWVLATPNRPLITGDRVWADAGARAELQIGALAVRLGSQTSATILNLDDSVAQFQLEQGSLNVRVRRIDPGQTIEIDTPLLAFALSRPGVYRIDVDPASAATTVAVRSGEGQAYGDGAAYTIRERQWYRFADSALRDYQYEALPPADAFDTWAQERDRREDSPVSARYVSPDVIGYSDLDEYGTWSTVEGYGNVWVPTRVASDWAPYQQGHWAWIEPWGWTWVDDAPWGFAPFHYGRWAYARERWCWVPGPVRARAVYAPALVAFVGGNDFRVTVGAGGPARGIAWFPLAPGEVYRPSYQVSRNYFTNVNVTNTNVSNTYITNVYNKPDAPNVVYRNREQRGGVTAMPAAAFVQSRSVAQSAVPVSREIATAAPVSAVASIAPVRASVLGGGATAPASGAAPAAGAGAVRRPPVATTQRPVIARAAPPPPPAPFTAREAALAKDPGRPAAPTAPVAARPAVAAPNMPTVKVVKPAGSETPPPAPTANRARTNAPAGTGAPPGAGGTPVPGPAPGAVPTLPPRPGVTPIPTPQPPAPSAPARAPVRPDVAPPKAEVVPTPTPPGPPAGRTPAPPEPAPAAPQPPRPPVTRPVPSPAPSGATPLPAPTPAPADLRREPVQPQGTNRPVPQPPPAAEMRREPPPPAVARPPSPPSPPPAELRREPAPAPAAAKPPAAPSPPPAEPRREVRPVPQEAPKPPVVQAPPPARPPAAVAPQPEVKAKAEAEKREASKGKPDEKRDEPK